MKAIVYTKYGPPDVLQLQDVEKPIPQENEVLIKVHASSINDWDWNLLRGNFQGRGWAFLKPKYKILGSDVAGQIESVGNNVTKFQPGDKVFGDLCSRSWGCFAEYVCAPENTLVLKPSKMTFEEAAALPQAGTLALQGVRKGQIQKGQRVLINGAGGGAGSFAVQIAKSFGAEITGVDNTEKSDMMRSIGADHVIDYTKEDFTKNGQTYDFILDFAAHHPFFDYKRALNPKGIYVVVGGSSARVLQVVFLGLLISRSKKMGLLLHKPNNDLDSLTKLIETGKVKTIIDKIYPLSKTAKAFQYFGEGHAKGKVVITLEYNNKT